MAKAIQRLKFQLDGEAARWPARLDKLEVTIPTINAASSVEDQIEALQDLLPEERANEALGDFLHTAVKNKLINQLDTWLKAKVGEGDDAKQRSETVTKDEVQKYCQALLLEPSQRKQGQGPKAKVARLEAQMTAAQDALVNTLAMISNKKDRQKAAEQYKKQGLLPDDYKVD